MESKANEQNKNEINNTNPDINPIKNTSNQININNDEKNKIKIDNQINIKKNESKEMKNDNNDDDNNINHIEDINNQVSKEEQVQKQLKDLLNETDLKEYIRSAINGYNTEKTGYTVFSIKLVTSNLLKNFIKQDGYKDKYNLLLGQDIFSKFLEKATIPKDLADLILLAWSCNRKRRIQPDVGPCSCDKSFPCLKQLYHDDVSPTGMVYFLSAFAENSLTLDEVNQVLSAKKSTNIVSCNDDGNINNWPGYQPTEKTFTIVLKAIESVSYDWNLTKDFMDVICKTLDFKTLNDKLKFNDISKIDNEVLEEINRFYAVICNTILHNRLDHQNS